jgi:hypothetical protein
MHIEDVFGNRNGASDVQDVRAVSFVAPAPIPAIRRSTAMRRHQVIVLASCATLLLAACGGADAEQAASPFEALFGAPESPAEMRAKQLEQEEVVAQCMREEGWEYTPVDWASQFPDQQEEDMTGSAFGEKYGYGIARSYEVYEWPYLDEDGNYNGDSGPGGNFEDPNAEYMMALSESEMQQYQEALYGDQSDFQPEFDPDTGEEIYNAPPPEEQGCYGKAQLEVYGDQPWNNPEFNERMSALNEDLENDPRLEDAEIDWSDCMYEVSEDYDFFGPNDVYQYVSNLFAEKKGQELVEVDPESGEIIGRPGEYPEGGWSMTEGDDVGIGYMGTARRLTEEEIREFQTMELAIWTDDQRCLDESGYADIRRQIEQELVDTIREEFPELIDDAGGDT